MTPVGDEREGLDPRQMTDDGDPRLGWGPGEWFEETQRLEAQVGQLTQELQAKLAGIGLPSTASLDDLIRHHRSNAALAVGFDQVAAERRITELEAALGEAAVVLEAFRLDEEREPYREHSLPMKSQILRASDMARAVLSTSKEETV